MKYLPINKDLFIQNRKSLANNLQKNSTAIFNSNDVMPTNSDGTMPFIQNSDLFWLSGIDQEESVLIIHYNKSKNLCNDGATYLYVFQMIIKTNPRLILN